MAVLCLLQVSGRRGQIVASDCSFATPRGDRSAWTTASSRHSCRGTARFAGRMKLASLLDTGAVTVTGIKKASRRAQGVSEFLAQRLTVKKAT